MKKLILLLSLCFITISTYGQTYSNPYPQPVKVQVTTNNNSNNFSNSFTKGLQAGAAARNARAAEGRAAAEATKDKSTKIKVDNLINKDGFFKGVYIKRVSGWKPANNKATIKNILKGSDKLNFFSKEKNLPKNTETLEKVLFLEWEREALNQYARLTKMTLSDYNGNIVYQAVYKNIPYNEMLLPLTSEYVITKEQAISKMKEFKELLDLEILTRREYDSILKELKPFIIKK